MAGMGFGRIQGRLRESTGGAPPQIPIQVSVKGVTAMSLRSILRGAPALLLLVSSAPSFAAVCEAVKLRVESQVNPMGVESARPRLLWQMADSRRGARQLGYRVLVASKPELLRDGKADLWDSLMVNSDKAVDVAYGGKRLESRGRAWWTVRVWDKDNRPSPWARASRWEVPLLKVTDWKAQWIGVKQAEAQVDSLTDAQWIWASDAKPGQDYAAGKRWFRASFELPNKPIRSAVLVGAVDEQFTATVNGQQAGSGNGWVTATSIPIQTLLKTGRNTIQVVGNNTGGPAGLAMLVRVTFDDGTTQRLGTGPDWQSSMAAPAGGDESKWMPASVLGPVGPGIWGTPKVSGGQGGPASLLRKTFNLSKPVKSARVYVTARGSYRLRINGERVGNDILTPDWTDYRKRIPYQVYDVTKLVRQGDNAVGAILGDGWYASGLGWALQHWSFGPGPTQLLMQLEVEYADGTRDTVVTDGTWKAAESAIQRSEIYAGETYDARKEQPGWDRPRFADSGWKAVDFRVGVDRSPTAAGWPGNDTAVEGFPPAQLVAQSSPAIQHTIVVEPLAITNPAPGVYIYDMGQNMVGWARLRVKGKSGDRIRMRFAEILQPNGRIYTDNLRRAEATDTYTCRGRGDSYYEGREFTKDSTAEDMRKPSSGEVWEPHFTYHGFRYIEVTGYPGTPGKGTIEGIVFHTAAPETASFSCSSEMVNKLWSNINWGLRGNLESVPTDCPQRDERLGWMGDAQIIWPTMTYLRDVQSFTHKWMHDVMDAQSAAGGFSDVSPRVIDEADGAPAWGDAGIVLPYTAWKRFADTRIIDETYPAMQRWLAYIDSANPDHLWMKRRNNDFGDWVAVNDTPTDKGVIATAYFAQDARMLSEMARAINKNADADKYEQLFRDIRSAFQKRFVHEDGTIGNGSETCYVLAMHMGLLEPAQESAAMRLLVADIERHNMHHTTGFIGTPFLMLVLSSHGRDDIAYTLLLNDTFPSWGYMIKKGATTMWERWNGDTGDPAMNSFNHYAYGAVGEWMVRDLGGIDRASDGTGFQRIAIHPRIDPRMTWADTSFDSPYGRVTSSWAAKAGEPFILNVTVPANTTAWVYVPAASPDRVMESGQPIDPASGIRFVKMHGDRAIFEVPAGSYKFEGR